jgi:membrane-bound acyltransferase YfiQ involved in biofilm formation
VTATAKYLKLEEVLPNNMKTSMYSLLKKPSAWIPTATSLIVLIVMLITIMLSGAPTRKPDEGVGAHLFQIWLVSEIFMIAFFALRWLPQRPVQALVVLMIQVFTMLLPMSIVFSLNV